MGLVVNYNVGNDDNNVETLNVNNNYTNLSELPHVVKIIDTLNNNIIFLKKFDNEHEAFRFLNNLKNSDKNLDNKSFILTGPNVYYST